jgi:hypothetical protein
MESTFLKIVSLIILGLGIYSGYANRLFGAVVMLFTVTLASLVAVNFYAPLAELFQDKFLGPLAPATCYLLLFVATMLAASVFYDRYFKKKVAITKSSNVSGGLFVGLLIGIVLSGSMVIGYKLMPMQASSQRGPAVLNADRVVLTLYDRTANAIPGENAFDPVAFQVQYIPPVDSNMLHLGFELMGSEKDDDRPLDKARKVLADEDDFYKALLKARDTLGPEAFVSREGRQSPRVLLDKVEKIGLAGSGKEIYRHSDFTFARFDEKNNRRMPKDQPLMWLKNPIGGSVLFLKGSGNLAEMDKDDFKAEFGWMPRFKH